MKKLIMNLILRIDGIKQSRPKLFKIGMLCLWLVAPLEMASIKLGIFGYKKIKSYNQKTIEQLK